MSTKLVVNLDLLARALEAQGKGPQSRLELGEAALEAGADGLALDPHWKDSDLYESDAASLASIAPVYPGCTLCFTGAPDEAFFEAMRELRPQAALFMPAPEAGAEAPDAGFNLFDDAEKKRLAQAIARAKDFGAAAGLFIDPEYELMLPAKDLGADFVLVNADAFAAAAGTDLEDVILGSLFEAVEAAKAAELAAAVGRGIPLTRFGAFAGKMAAITGGLDAISLGAELADAGQALPGGWWAALRRAADFLHGGHAYANAQAGQEVRA